LYALKEAKYRSQFRSAILDIISRKFNCSNDASTVNCLDKARHCLPLSNIATYVKKKAPAVI